MQLLAWIISTCILFIATIMIVGYQYLKAKNENKKSKVYWSYKIEKVK